MLADVQCVIFLIANQQQSAGNGFLLFNVCSLVSQSKASLN